MKRLIKRIFIVFIIIIILAIGTFTWFAKSNTKNWGDNPKILKANIKNGNKKALVVYQPSRGKITNKNVIDYLGIKR